MLSVVSDVVLSRVLPLNNSKSKFAVIGLEKVKCDGKSDIWQPSIKLLGQFWTGVSLSIEEWRNLKASFEKIENYFNTGYSKGPIKLSDKMEVTFTANHQNYGITITKKSK